MMYLLTNRYNRTGYCLLIVAGLCLAWQCAPSPRDEEKETREAIPIPSGSSDEILARLAPYLVANPKDKLEEEVNTLINTSIDQAWDLHYHPPGILYAIHTEGQGRTLKWGDYISVHYQGWNLDGKIFDSSFRRTEPFQFYVGNVVPGWNEILQNILVEGSRGVFLIPATLAYGEEGFDKLVPPNENLVFDMEVLSLIKRSTE